MSRIYGYALVGAVVASAALVVGLATGRRSPPHPADIAKPPASIVGEPTAEAAARAALERATASKDPREAARLLEGAANAGSAQAAFLLGNAYRAGAGVPRSDAKALALYESAAEREHPAALQSLAMAYLYGELGLEPDEAASRRFAMEAEHALRSAR